MQLTRIPLQPRISIRRICFWNSILTHCPDALALQSKPLVSYAAGPLRSNVLYFQVEVELLKEDNEQLVTQYEREKQLRKANEQRNLEIEDQYEGERKEMAVKIDSMSSIVKMFELKAKNSTDQITRLEDKEAEMKKEYSKLHDRYTDLFKTHMDYMERSKAVMGSERLEQMMSMGSARQRIAGMSLNQLNRWMGPFLLYSQECHILKSLETWNWAFPNTLLHNHTPTFQGIWGIYSGAHLICPK